MYIDQARHDGAVAQVNYLVRLGQIRSYLTLGANSLNSIATDRYETFKRQVPRTGKDALRRQDRQTIRHHNHLHRKHARDCRYNHAKDDHENEELPNGLPPLAKRNPSHGKTGDRHARHGADGVDGLVGKL